MRQTIEEMAEQWDMPTWKVAAAMVRLVKSGRSAPPNGATPDDHIEWLERTYPKPENVK